MIGPRSIGATIVVVLLVCGADEVLGRKCVCTSKACRENNVKSCKTRYACYTELIYSGEPGAPSGATIRTTRGCTESATPLLCETKSWHSSDEEAAASTSLELLGRSAWPRLTCCDDRDYCNAADEDFEPTARPDDDRVGAAPHNSSHSHNTALDQGYPDVAVTGGTLDPQSSNIQQLHFVALVLSVAALISVFAACYVVTRFLNASGVPQLTRPYVADRLDF